MTELPHRPQTEQDCCLLLAATNATPSEIEDFVEILLVESNPLQLTSEDAQERLNEWRADKRRVAALIRQDRTRTLAAGYRSSPPEAPVYLNGVTAW